MFAHSNILSRYHIPRAKFPNPPIHPSIRSTTDSSFMAICQYYTVRIQNSLTGTVHLTHIITVAVIKTNAAMSVHSTAFLSRISSYLNGKYSISPASKLNKPIHFISHYEMDEPVLSFWLFHFPVILSHWQLLFLLLLLLLHFLLLWLLLHLRRQGSRCRTIRCSCPSSLHHNLWK